MKRVIDVFLCCAVAWTAFGGAVFEHCVYDAVSLNGEWEMAYRPYAHEDSAGRLGGERPLRRCYF